MLITYICKALAIIFMLFLIYIVKGTYKVMAKMPNSTDKEKIEAFYIAISLIIDVVVLIFVGVKVITG